MILFLILNIAGCCLLYLSHRHQGWLAQPIGPLGAAGGAAALLLALAAACFALSPLAAVFAWLAVSMLAFSLLPFASLLKGKP
ncbi:hypothetical protein [Pseudoduganella violaceinigra]|uniref:hypothetical protein n=1 Tax=Pseudoduganella violaceinigra TaxID=246602 RepID=UPI000405D4E8|nr:hypothetical protein [Pseudoduganella violaceinigra]